MHYAFPFLPLEVQTSIKEIIALGTIPESAIDLLIARTSKALEDKTTSLQMDVVRIEESIEQRIDRIGDKLAADVRTQLGATNQMLVDIHGDVQSQGAAVVALRAEFQTFGESVSGRIGELEQRQDQLEQRVNAQYSESKNDRADLRKQGKATQAALKDLSERVHAFMARIDSLIAQSIPQEKAEQYRAFLDELMAEREASG